MASSFADQFPNPYASPQSASVPAPAPAAAAAKPGSLAIIFPGFVCVLLGYFTSNLFLIGDLYKIGMGPNNEPVASPFALVFTTPPQLWMAYLLCAAVFVAGALMIGSQRFNPMAVVCYVMCPLVGAIFAIASPLRIVKKYAEPVAAGYLLIGSCLAFTGATRLFLLYGHSGGSFQPVAASMMAEAGVALIAGAVLKFVYGNSPTKAGDAAPAILPAELADCTSARS